MAAITYTDNELTALRKRLLPNTVFVPTSGKSGDIDSTNIQAAIDSVESSWHAYGGGAVLLAGKYNLSKPLRLGALNTPCNVTLRGIGDTWLVFNPSSQSVPGSSPYALVVYGPSYVNAPVIRDITLHCEYKSRGILFANSKGSIENLAVWYTIESGIDFIDCWNMNIRNVTSRYANGFAMRCYQSNACHFDSVQLDKNYGISSSDNVPATSNVIVEAAMQRGNAAVLADHAAYPTAVERWPSETDTLCTNVEGVAFRTTKQQRSALYIAGSYGSTFTNLMIQSQKYTDYPVVYLGENAHANVFTSIYDEANRCRFEHIKCAGASHNQFTNTFISRAVGGEDCECWLRCTGNTSGNSVRRLAGVSGLSDHIVILDGGTHSGTTCLECATRQAEIATADWIGESNTPTVNAWDDEFIFIR